MLKIIDVILSFGLVMFLVSGLVMLLTQALNRLIHVRSIFLISGLGRLLEYIEPSFGCFKSKLLVWRLLCKPVAGGALFILPGDYINKEDFIVLLLEKGAQLSTKSKPENGKKPAKPLQIALTNNGVSNPESTVSEIRRWAAQLESKNPSLSIRERQKIAIAQFATTDFFAKINFWFDQTIDRVSDTFTAWTRLVVLLFSLVFAAAINLNGVHLINKLWSYDITRDTLVKAAENVQYPECDFDGKYDYLTNLCKIGINDLVKLGLIREPILPGWTNLADPGIILSSLLLSLGAPFWYDLLKSVLNLRGKMAFQNEKQDKLEALKNR